MITKIHIHIPGALVVADKSKLALLSSAFDSWVTDEASLLVGASVSTKTFVLLGTSAVVKASVLVKTSLLVDAF